MQIEQRIGVLLLSEKEGEREGGGGGMFIGNLSIVTLSVVCWLLLRFIDSYSVVGGDKYLKNWHYSAYKRKMYSHKK